MSKRDHTEHAPELCTILYSLYTLRDPLAMPVSGPRIDDILRRASPDLVVALEWAKAHPDFRFERLLPDLPLPRAQLHRFLCNVLMTWEQRWGTPYR